jgi:hypothetical protein
MHSRTFLESGLSQRWCTLSLTRSSVIRYSRSVYRGPPESDTESTRTCNNQRTHYHVAIAINRSASSMTWSLVTVEVHQPHRCHTSAHDPNHPSTLRGNTRHHQDCRVAMQVPLCGKTPSWEHLGQTRVLQPLSIPTHTLAHHQTSSFILAHHPTSLRTCGKTINLTSCSHQTPPVCSLQRVLYSKQPW